MPPVLTLDAARNLLGYARQLSTGSTVMEWQLAVIFAQSACELRTDKALSDLLQHLSAPLKEAVLGLCGQTVSLMDENTRKWWCLLTDDKVGKKTLVWWKEWTESRELRNDVAHQGRSVTFDDAARSVALAERYIDHVTRVAAAITAPK